METINLTRLHQDNTLPTQGAITYKGKLLCLTLEPPWKNNERKVSCIPAGVYVCKQRKSEKAKGMTFEVMNVPGRSSILFHPGNTVMDTEGCILVGMQVGDWLSPHSVALSLKGFENFMKVLGPVQSFTMEILWPKMDTKTGPNAITF